MTQSPTLGAVLGTGASGSQVRQDLNLSDQAVAPRKLWPNAPSPTYPYMRWRDSTTGDLYMRRGDNAAWLVLEKRLAVNQNPTVNDDSADGFHRGSFWINDGGNKVFVCLNNAAGAAQWGEIIGGTGGAVTSVFGRGGAVTATSGDYTADKITDGGGKVIMTSAERSKLANVNSYWTSRLTRDPALAVKNTTLGQHDLRSLLIFYAAPIIINAVYDPDYAAAMLARYDDVVLGNDLANPSNPNYSTTSTIITKLAALAPNTVVWGYIDIGVNAPASNHSLASLQTQIDQWIAIGARGIFCDDYGYDFGVTRARQNSVLDYIHGKGVGAMMNAWNIADALSPAIVATYNPSGTAAHADARDVYLLESWVFNSDAWTAPHYATFWDLKTRGDDARTWRSSSGVRMYAVNIMQHSGTSNETLDAYRGMAEALAHIWRLDGLAVAMSNYVATGADIGLVKPYPPLIRPMPGGRLTAPYTLNGAWTEVQAADLGLTVHFEPGNYSWTAS